MSRSPHVLIPLLTLKDNGGVSVALALARALLQSGARVTVVASDYHGSAPCRRPENAGIGFVTTPAVGRNIALSMLVFFVLASLRSLLTRPTLVYTHIATCLIPQFRRGEPYWLAQDIEYRFFRGSTRRLMKALFGRALHGNTLLVTSDWLGRFMRRSGARIACCGDVGLATRWLSNQAPEVRRDIDFLLIAKKGAHKRQRETRSVALELARRHFLVQLIDQEKETWPELDPEVSARLTRQDAVPSETMAALFARARVFVSLSSAEGYGLTPLEALAYGACVLSTPTPSVSGLSHPRLSVLSGRADIEMRAVETAIRCHRMADSLATGHEVALPTMEAWTARAAAATVARLTTS
ncbi:MAG: glycosyltransferase [Burkholderiaceae bacterium]|nr:glycosyltransferase [Burkholderiaceae bacterium]